MGNKELAIKRRKLRSTCIQEAVSTVASPGYAISFSWGSHWVEETLPGPQDSGALNSESDFSKHRYSPQD